MRFIKLAVVAIALPVAACSSGPAASPTPPSAISCVEAITLKNPPRLTLSTDLPATPRWWGGDPSYQFPNEPANGSGWTGGEPYSIEGFEGGVSYSLGNALGFEYDEIDWVPNDGPAEIYSDGAKAYDFLVAHVPARADRTAQVDFSETYFESQQSVVALDSNAIASATSVALLRSYRLGAVEQSSSAAVIESVVQPTTEPTVYADQPAAVAALKAGEIDGFVVDVQTAHYLTQGWHESAEEPPPLSNGTIVGQFSRNAWVDKLAVVLEKGSPMTPCVNAAIDQIRAENFLDEYTEEYIISGEVPDFT
ncbi:MAG: transporter substrate-binding domain-containing protein [Candidatus Limnocylindrales bacterium]